MTLAVALEPVYGIALAFAVLGEVSGLRTLAGGAMIIAAALIATLSTEPGAVPSRRSNL
jgi:drug/metabolite transporter (DMT)-like permease